MRHTTFFVASTTHWQTQVFAMHNWKTVSQMEGVLCDAICSCIALTPLSCATPRPRTSTHRSCNTYKLQLPHKSLTSLRTRQSPSHILLSTQTSEYHVRTPSFSRARAPLNPHPPYTHILSPRSHCPARSIFAVNDQARRRT